MRVRIRQAELREAKIPQMSDNWRVIPRFRGLQGYHSEHSYQYSTKCRNRVASKAPECDRYKSKEGKAKLNASRWRVYWVFRWRLCGGRSTRIKRRRRVEVKERRPSWLVGEML